MLFGARASVPLPQKLRQALNGKKWIAAESGAFTGIAQMTTWLNADTRLSSSHMHGRTSLVK